MPPTAVVSTVGFFGEIGPLRDVPRTATVVADTGVQLLTLPRVDVHAVLSAHLFAIAMLERSADVRVAP